MENPLSRLSWLALTIDAYPFNVTLINFFSLEYSPVFHRKPSLVNVTKYTRSLKKLMWHAKSEITIGALKFVCMQTKQHQVVHSMREYQNVTQVWGHRGKGNCNFSHIAASTSLVSGWIGCYVSFLQLFPW